MITTKVTTTKHKPTLAALLIADPALVVVEMAPEVEVVPVCSATLTPKEVAVMTVPDDVVV